MMITIQGLAPITEYADVKLLMKQECNIDDFILDNLLSDVDGTKKVRVGLANDSEGFKLIKCLNGYRMAGNFVIKVSPYSKPAASNQASYMYSGGLHSSDYDNVQYPNHGMREEQSDSWNRQIDQTNLMKQRDVERREMARERVADQIEKRYSPSRKSRSPVRRDRSPIRDRFKRSSPSPRSWALEKRRSPDAPPPPVWPGSRKNDDFDDNRRRDEKIDYPRQRYEDRGSYREEESLGQSDMEERLPRDEAIEEIAQKILERNEEYKNVHGEQRRHILEELKQIVTKIVYEMFGDSEVSYIEVITKYQARYNTKDEAKIFQDAMQYEIPKQFRPLKRHALESANIPAKTSRVSPSTDLKQDITVKLPPPAVVNMTSTGVPQHQLVMSQCVMPVMVSSPYYLTYDTLQHNLQNSVHFPEPTQPVVDVQQPVVPVQDFAPPLFTEEDQKGGYKLYLCKDDFERISHSEADFLKEFLISKMFQGTGEHQGWSPDFTFKGLQNIYRYEVVTKDEWSKNWLLNLDFTEFEHFHVLVYTQEELWYERAAIWLPGHSRVKNIEPLQTKNLYGHMDALPPQRDACLYCKQDGHGVVACLRFKDLKVQGRRQITKQRWWCFLCLGLHLARDCARSTICTSCGGRHHKLLCLNRFDQQHADGQGCTQGQMGPRTQGRTWGSGQRDQGSPGEEVGADVQANIAGGSPTHWRADGISRACTGGCTDAPSSTKGLYRTLPRVSSRSPPTSDAQMQEQDVSYKKYVRRGLPQKGPTKKKYGHMGALPSERDACLYCKQDGHGVAACLQFKDLRVQGRRQITQQRCWCFLCLGLHLARDCARSTMCTSCGGRHHDLLCLNRLGQQHADGQCCTHEQMGPSTQGRTWGLGQRDKGPSREEVGADVLAKIAGGSPSYWRAGGGVSKACTGGCKDAPSSTEGLFRTPPRVSSRSPPTSVAQIQEQDETYKKYVRRGPPKNGATKNLYGHMGAFSPERDACLYCKQDGHGVTACLRFKDMGVQGRRQITKQRCWCFLCLGLHLARDCARSTMCTSCGGRHHDLLCLNRLGQQHADGQCCTHGQIGPRTEVRTWGPGQRDQGPRREEIGAWVSSCSPPISVAHMQEQDET